MKVSRACAIEWSKADKFDEPACKHCGRCMLAGMCCTMMAKDINDANLRKVGMHPEQIAERQRLSRERRIARRAEKRANKA